MSRILLKDVEDSGPTVEIPTLNAYVVCPNEIRAGDQYGYKVIVAVRFGGWTAYRGPTHWSDSQVAAYGDAISEEAALLLFPTFSDLRLPYSY